MESKFSAGDRVVVKELDGENYNIGSFVDVGSVGTVVCVRHGRDIDYDGNYLLVLFDTVKMPGCRPIGREIYCDESCMEVIRA